MLLYEDHKDIVYALAFSPDGSLLASAARDGSILLRGVDGSVIPVQEPSPNHGAIYALSFHPDTPVLAIGGELGWSAFLQRPDGRWQTFGPSMNTPTNDLAFLDARTLAVGLGERLKAAPGKLELWDWPAGRRVDPFFVDPHGVRAVAVSPRKKIIAWASCQRMIQVWDTRKQDPVKFRQDNNALAAAITRDGTHLAVSGDYAVRLFDVERQREKAVLKVHKGLVPAVAFSPDGRTLATGSWDQTVKLWDVETGRERQTYEWPVGRVTRLAYAPDGMRLAASGDTGALVVWDME
jgi:WD40 repeat protein